MNTMIRTTNLMSSLPEHSIRRGGPASQYRRVERSSVARHPNYVLRRCVAAFVAVGIVLVMAVLLNGLLASFGGRPASAAEARPAAELSASPSTYVAQPGDSLWSIASENHGNVDHGAYVDELIRINGDTAIVVGQAVILP
jgi:LysM domain